jgi:excisionase family DNA binding protein
VNEKVLLTVEEVAEFLRIAPNTVYRWCRDGKLAGIKIGKEWRIARAELDSFLTRQAGPPEHLSLESMFRRRLSAPEHILVMASDPRQVYALQAEFLQIGLDDGRPLFVGAWWQRPGEIRANLSEAGLPVAELEAADKLRIGDLTAAYTVGGAHGAVEVWRREAVERSSPILWGTGSHRLSDWQGRLPELLRFEAELHEAFHQMPVIALCPCMLDPVDKPGFDTLLELVPHHSSALFMPRGEPVLMRVGT